NMDRWTQMAWCFLF
ncbi:hypothetical protein VC87395_003378B, partial [Vibrio paracholerae 87395]